jgi:hypothetical protein
VVTLWPSTAYMPGDDDRHSYAQARHIREACHGPGASCAQAPRLSWAGGQGDPIVHCQHAPHGTTCVYDTRAGEARALTSPLDPEAGASRGAHAAVSPRRIA